MIPTVDDFKENIGRSSVCGVYAAVTLENGVFLALYSDRFAENTLYIEDDIGDMGAVNIGSTSSQKVSFELLNYDGKLDGYNFNGAECRLRFISGESFQRGVFTIYAQNTRGKRIPIYGYDRMADPDKNVPIPEGTNFTGLTCLQALELVGYTNIGTPTFPNYDYVLPEVKATSSYALGTSATARQVLGWIAQICGCYARYNYNGILELKSYDLLEYGDDLDGGTFSEEADSADGGLFIGAFSRNLLPLPYKDETVLRNGLQWTLVTDTGSVVSCYGEAEADTTFELRTHLTFPVGRYKFGATHTGSPTTYYACLYKLDTSTHTYRVVTRQYTGLAHFEVTSASDDYALTLRVISGTDMGSSLQDSTLFHPIIFDEDENDTSWIYYQEAWQGGYKADGGIFDFWKYSQDRIVTNADAYPLIRIMTEPTVAGARRVVNGVRVNGQNGITSFVGLNDYIIEINDNPFVTSQTVADEVAQNVYDTVSGVNFLPFSVDWAADPTFEAGDLIKFEYMNELCVTVNASYHYSLGNTSNIACNTVNLTEKEEDT